MNTLAFIWSGLIAFGIIMYVLLGGFDIGIGILSAFIREEKYRDIMVSTILPVWDGNQTWLVFGGAALYGAFPIAFSTILPIMYIPIFIMVIALLFRGISFEFRLKAIKTKRLWEICFFLGSITATAAQGVTLGTFVQGFSNPYVINNSFIPFWINPFCIFCVIALIFGYILLAADYLIIKTTGELQARCFKIANIVQYIILLGFIIVSAWSPFLNPEIKARWFNLTDMPFLAILPLLTLIFFVLHWRAIRTKHEHIPFWSAIGMFLMCYSGFIISIYPYIVPRTITFSEAAAPRSSLIFMLVGACIMLPALLYYTYHSYKIFRGKVTTAIGY
jgi:cytochrome bd ubiquinol oxidase subunit II